MGKVYENILGTARIEICGTFPEGFLNACAINAVELWKMNCVDDYTIEMTVYEKDVPILEHMAQRAMCSFRTIEIKGGSNNKRFLRKRKWLFIFLLAAFILLMISSLFIWEIDVHGNSELSKAEILRALNDCGVREGSFWPEISAELVRSQMLTKLPKLSWMTVNISASRAIVLIRERQDKPEIYVETEPANIIAAESGIIRDLYVTEGSTQISRGQTVQKGQLLVSSEMESIGGKQRYVCSKANIIADTCREIKMLYPSSTEKKTEDEMSCLRFAVKFGKKRINFYLNGRNNIDEYDKIITEYKLGVGGLFALPLSVVQEKLVWYKGQKTELDISDLICEQQLERLSESIEGSIEHSSFSKVEKDGISYVTLYAQCREDIAKTVKIQ